ncbi:uncharacterized protein UV8b_06108 [Ustilaginoidea virens]|uniref:Carboxylesterase type B domain-containing protein n=1 Tax=Ustilaginoidea virens TaxID=1159556 RepID=A0A063CCR9_USTVR|nr:uncharacterized protein UV8b_06108 [Ustilaginoidea virens]QUC21867.1 hypothetical protein UV8b_06108 [Ustilaginoidea virens]GAO17390.1 hypothetical protein UVI_02024280 [Ustilaginoidea virens]
MRALIRTTALVGLYAALVASSPARQPLEPDSEHILEERATLEVNLPSGGTITGSSSGNVESFKGIPFADPPVGPLRLKPPVRFSGTFGRRDGTRTAPACPQMLFPKAALDKLGPFASDVLQLPMFAALTGQEDCLTVSIQRPAGTKADAKLPVLFWIYGGAFHFGATSTYDATSLLKTAVGQNQPFIFVAVNYRVGGFGFMPGKEILADGSANLGLLDQRMGLEWVADNIAAFGGDPSKVTTWGLSAGAISVFDQLVLFDGNATYKGKPLFRGAIMNSGTIAPADPVDCPKGQAVYNQVVQAANCSGAADTLACLRQRDYKTFLAAANSVPGMFSYQSVALSYLPRPDGRVLTDSPDKLLQSGRYHAVPMIVGDQEDEGTMFALGTRNLTTAERAVDYLSKFYFPSATKAQLAQFVSFYNPAVLQGSPFRTGFFNDWYPGFKRMAAVLGDLSFTLSRRVALGLATQANPSVPVWSYLSSYLYGTPVLGTFHVSDLLQVFFGTVDNNAMRSCRTYYFNFLHNQDPNKGVGGYANWPRWQDAKKLMWFRWPFANDYVEDNFRSQAADFIAQNRDSLRV